MIHSSLTRRGPVAARRISAFVAVVAASVLPAACSSSADSRNESYELLRSVPVPLNEHTLSSIGELELTEGQVLRHQTYTIQPSGEFTLNRLIESEVGSVGASFSTLSPSDAERIHMEPFSGVLVRSVRSKGPADRAGISSRDAILAVGDERVTSPDHLVHLIESAPLGTRVPVEFNHDGSLSSTIVEIAGETRTESIRVLHRQLPVLDDRARSGLRIAEVPRDIHSIVLGERADEGGLLVLEMLPGGPAFFSSLRVRDLITAIDGRPVATHAEYQRALLEHTSGEKVLFQAQRGRARIETQVTLDHDATSSSGFDLLSLVEYRKKPDKRRFSMIWSILFHSQTCHRVLKNKDNAGEHTTYSNWGAFLDLLRYSQGPEVTRFDLLWILPITFHHDEES